MGSSVIVGAATGNTIANKIKADQEKQGSVKNRIKYGFKQSINYKKASLKDTFTTAAGVAASVGAAASIKNSKAAQRFLKKASDYAKDVLNEVKDLDFAKKIEKNFLYKSLKEGVNKFALNAKKAAKWVKALPKPAKVVLAAGVAITAIASRAIRNKSILEAGKIMKEQEISAKLEKQENQKAKELLS